jgi:type IV pilus assembly protein PilX
MIKLVLQVQQKGFILITTLVLIVVLTVLAVTEISVNNTQTRLATNATDSEISFEKAEGALNEAINQVMNHSYNAESFLRNTNGLYLFDKNATPAWQTINWDSNNTSINSFQGNSHSQASYIIEQLPSVVQPGQNMKALTRVYRITTRSVGENGHSSLLLQSTVQIQQ